MITDRILKEYTRLGSITTTAKALCISHTAVRKCLVSHGVIDTPFTREVSKLYNAGYTTHEISEMLNISESWVSANAPYIKGTLLEPSNTENAKRIRRCRKNKLQKAIKSLKNA